MLSQRARLADPRVGQSPIDTSVGFRVRVNGRLRLGSLGAWCVCSEVEFLHVSTQAVGGGGEYATKIGDYRQSKV